MTAPKPIARHEFDAAELVASHPPRLQHPKKKLVFGIACPPGAVHSGRVVFTRWRCMPLPPAIPEREPVLEAREDVFGYEAPAAGAVEWHLNFADPALFFAYGTSLLAQDELQVAEHPALGSLREALVARRIDCSTVEGPEPSPVLVTGVERRCRIATRGLYGNAFARASDDAIRRATTALSPPTITNVVAMAAPSGRSGSYLRPDVDYVTKTAFTAFEAARLESGVLDPAHREVAIHTGFWGCGAFGGNRVLMALLQLVAARLAGIERVVFHTFDRAGTTALDTARRHLRELVSSGRATRDVLEDVLELNLLWGVSDGN
ncbi:MAG TPA: hypothetical protein VFF73_34670 [Planctomycetota bacterium]|nr:hypothetical protein [Planctomycetota bacterium]